MQVQLEHSDIDAMMKSALYAVWCQLSEQYNVINNKTIAYEQSRPGGGEEGGYRAARHGTCTAEKVDELNNVLVRECCPLYVQRIQRWKK